MKAIEYAERYKQEGQTLEALGKVCKDIFLEFKPLSEIRHAKTDSAVIAIVMELDNKWRAFARKSGDATIVPNGFILFCINIIPEMERILKPLLR